MAALQGAQCRTPLWNLRGVMRGALCRTEITPAQTADGTGGKSATTASAIFSCRNAPRSLKSSWTRRSHSWVLRTVREPSGLRDGGGGGIEELDGELQSSKVSTPSKNG